MKYKYEFINETVEIEVDDGWEKLLEEMDYEETLNERRETRRGEPLYEDWDTDWVEDKNEHLEEEALERDIENQIIRKAAKVLTKKQLMIFICLYKYHLRGVDCAARMNISPQAIYHMLPRIRKRLKHAF